MTQIALMARWGSDIILRYVAETPLETITQSFARSSTDPARVNQIAAAAARQEADQHDEVNLALTCADSETEDDEDLSRFAVHESSGTIHLLTPPTTEGPAHSERTICGRQPTAAYSLLIAYSDSFVHRGALKPTANCTQCASAATWLSLVNAASHTDGR